MMKSIAVAVLAFGAVAFTHAEEPPIQQTDYSEVAAAINKTMRRYHYDPAELDTPGYRQIEAAITALAEAATSDADFVDGFRDIWKNGPFSHVEFRTAKQRCFD